MDANTFYDSAAYEASKAVKTSAGRLLFLYGYNSGPAQFLQVHDATALPANGGVPKVTQQIASAKNFFISMPNDGKPFANGIVVCNSTTGPTVTIGAADCWFNVEFR